jgi:FkbM family methyltransferase
MTLFSELLTRLRAGRDPRPSAAAGPAPAPAAPSPAADASPAQSWSVVSTVSEPPALVRAFVAWHLALGAERVFLFVDDPARWTGPGTDLPGAATVVPCDASYWRRRRRDGIRPADHRIRQIANATLAYDWNASDWLVHVDADEYVYPRSGESVGAILARLPAGARAVHGTVFEQIFEPSAPPRDFAFRGRFRAQLPFDYWTSPEGKRTFPHDRECFTRGMAAHASPKVFLRRGMDVTRFRIHGADEGPERVEIPSTAVPELALLHFDAGAYDRWTRKFGARARDDAYMASMAPWKRGKQLSRFRAAQDGGRPEDLEALFRRLYCPNARQRAAYERFGVALEADLGIEAKLAALDAAAAAPPRGERVETFGARLEIRAGDNFTETYMLRHGRPREESDIARLVGLVRGRRALILDVGANCGLYTVALGVNAGPGSLCRSFEPNPVLLRRLRANLALNPGVAVEAYAVAISDRDGLLNLDGGRNGNLGEARLREADRAPEGRPVKVRQLRAFAEDADDFELLVVKIDVEGHEPQVLRTFLPFLADKAVETALLFEHTQMSPGSLAEIERRLRDGGFAVEARTEWNLILRRPARAPAAAPAARAEDPAAPPTDPAATAAPPAAPAVVAGRGEGRIVIHAGVQRTGTTSLQRFLETNRPRLGERGVLYPAGRRSHHGLAHALRRGEAGPERVLELAPPHVGAATAILSAESFCRHRDLGWLAEVAKRRRVEAVFYLRRQDHWLMSWCNQNIRWPFDPRLARATPERFLERVGDFHWLDYARLIDRWSAALGADAVTARILEPGQVEDVVSDFCDVVGLDRAGLEAPAERRNASLPVHLIELARCLDFPALEPAARRRVIEALRTALADKAVPGAALFSPAQRRAVLAQFAASNAALAAARFGRDRLFLEPPPAPDAPVFAFPDLDRETLLRDWIAPVLRALA